MTTFLNPRLAVVLVSMFIAGTVGKAVPITVLSPLGLPDRDVIRDPYASFASTFGASLAPKTGGVVGPNIGSNAGFVPPPLVLGGGGGGFFPSLGALPRPTGAAQIVQNLTPSQNASVVLFLNLPRSQAVVALAAQGVPDGGSALILLGSALLATVALRRRLKK